MISTQSWSAGWMAVRQSPQTAKPGAVRSSFDGPKAAQKMALRRQQDSHRTPVHLLQRRMEWPPGFCELSGELQERRGGMPNHRDFPSVWVGPEVHCAVSLVVVVVLQDAGNLHSEGIAEQRDV